MLTKEQRKVLEGISPEDGFAYFAGCEEIINLAHATIYFGNDKFYVVGVVTNGESIRVECDTVEEAAEEWKSLFEGRNIVDILMRLRQRQKKS